MNIEDLEELKTARKELIKYYKKCKEQELQKFAEHMSDKYLIQIALDTFTQYLKGKLKMKGEK